MSLPPGAKTSSSRFMWWQPENSGLSVDQWAVDELLVSGYSDLRNVDDDFDAKSVKSTPNYSWFYPHRYRIPTIAQITFM